MSDFITLISQAPFYKFVMIAQLLFPLLMALILFSVKGKNAKFIALLSSVVTLLLTVVVYQQYAVAVQAQDPADPMVYQLQLAGEWLSFIQTKFSFGLDGLAMLMLFLTNILVPIIIYSSFKDERPASFYALILMMQFGLLGVFMSTDGLLFYLFWEITLIPIWFICGLFGTGENKNRVFLKFFIYTFFGSLFMLVGLIYTYLHTAGAHNYHIIALMQSELSGKEQTFVFWMFFLAFAIKLPIFPFHTWQPDTYTQAPTQGSMLLSGIMLKMGVFGLMRYLIPLVPLAVTGLSGQIALVLSIIGIVYASIIAITRKNIKQLIAYSSIAHVGLIAAGIFASAMVTNNCGVVNAEGMQGAAIQMLAHGINVVGLFYVADILYKKYGTYNIKEMGGLAKAMPVFAVLFMIIAIGTMAVPLSNGFIGEFLLLKSVFNYNTIAAVFAGLTIILCAVYVLRMYSKTMFGEGDAVKLAKFSDISMGDTIALGIIAALIIICGIYPQPILALTEKSVEFLLKGIR